VTLPVGYAFYTTWLQIFCTTNYTYLHSPSKIQQTQNRESKNTKRSHDIFAKSLYTLA